MPVDRTYYLAFIGGECYDNSYQARQPASSCFCLTAELYGQYVDYFSTEGGAVFSAGLRRDIDNLGYPHAPVATDGRAPSSAQFVIPVCENMEFIFNVRLHPWTLIAAVHHAPLGAPVTRSCVGDPNSCIACGTAEYHTASTACSPRASAPRAPFSRDTVRNLRPSHLIPCSLLSATRR